MSKAVIVKSHRKSVRKIAVVAWLIVYVTGTSQFELLHSLIHNHQLQATHSFGQKKDACDLSVYFNDSENGCHHHSHFVVSDKCNMCDLACHDDQPILATHVFSSREFSSNYIDRYKLTLDSYCAVISSSRAPPAIA